MANALAEYIDDFASISGYEIPDAPTLDQVTKGAARDQIKWGLAATREIWEGIDPSVRKKAIAAIDGMIQQIDDLGEITSVVTATLDGLGDIDVPLIQEIMQLVVLAVGLAKVNTEISVYAMQMGRQASRALTIMGMSRSEAREDHDEHFVATAEGRPGYETDPFDWVATRKIQGYIKYVWAERKPTTWSWEPSFNPLQKQAMLFDWGEFHPRGRWRVNSGIPMVCGLGSSVAMGILDDWGDCHPPGTSSQRDEYREDQFESCFTTIMPHCFPWGILSERPGPYQIACFKDQGCDEAFDINSILARRQIEMLSIPRVNFRANGGIIKHMGKRMARWLDAKLFWEHSDVGMMDEKGQFTEWWAFDGRYGIDKEFDPSNTGGEASRRFYLDDSLVIRAYTNSSTGTKKTPDLTRIGFRQIQDDYDSISISFAMYNMVVEGALLFWTARMNFLEDHKLCRGLMESPSFIAKIKDKGLAEAIEASSKIVTKVPVHSGGLKFAPPPAKPNPPRAKSPTIGETRPPSSRPGRASSGFRGELGSTQRERESATSAYGWLAVGAGFLAAVGGGVLAYNELKGTK